MDGVSATLIVSISGIHERTLADCMEFAGELDARRTPVSWLLPPRPRQGRHRPDSTVIDLLRRRSKIGDALVLHGFDHTVAPGARPRIGPRAEFAGLPRHEATLRLIAATRIMDELGLRSEVFAPPRWLASTGTVVALRRRGFRVCADHTGVRLLDHPGEHGLLLRGKLLRVDGNGTENADDPRGTSSPTDLTTAGVLRTGRLATGRLGTGRLATGMLATRLATGRLGSGRLGSGRLGVGPEAAEAWRHRSLIATAGRTARRGGMVRLAVHAGELVDPSTRAAILDAADAALAEGALPRTYRAPSPTPAPLSA
jgi:uncharacterized protein